MNTERPTPLPPPSLVGAIVVSAGASTRMEGKDKILVDLGGDHLVARTVSVLERCAAIGAIVLVVREKNLAYAVGLSQRAGWKKVLHILAGGERRQDSVRVGLSGLPHCEWVVVHDGARPLVTPALIEAGLRAAVPTGAATAVVPATDTVKRVSDDGRVLATLDRRELVMVQTPQVFRRDLLERSHDENTVDVTDDAAMLERLGHDVRVFPGSVRNIKVTTPDDLLIAAALIADDES